MAEVFRSASALCYQPIADVLPSGDTPCSGGLYFAEILEEAGIPAGVLNVVTCSRNSVGAVGDELISNPRVKAISLTGSTAVGRQIAAKCGADLNKVCVEPGGKDSMIVLDDADLDAAARAASFGSFMHQGQVCMSTEMLLVHENVWQPFMDRFLAQARKLKTGQTNVIGPSVDTRQAQRVKALIGDAVAKGATVELGGRAWDNFVEPTVLANVNTSMNIWHDETFGRGMTRAPCAWGSGWKPASAMSTARTSTTNPMRPLAAPRPAAWGARAGAGRWMRLPNCVADAGPGAAATSRSNSEERIAR